MVDDSNVWKRCLSCIQEQIKPKSFENWFAESHGEVVESKYLRITVSSTVAADWLQAHYSDLIVNVVLNATAMPLKVVFEVRETARELAEARGVESGASAELEPNAQKTVRAEQELLPSSEFNKEYVFDTYVVGEGNRLAHAAASAVVESPGSMRFNPLFIFGGPGLGKTHLLHAIGNLLLSSRPGVSVHYATAEAFMQEFIESLKDRTTHTFKRQYRSRDYLLVDDVQFLLRGDHTQNEFFHTFNELHQGGRQIVMTCDRPPERLEGAEDRLISRFKWGLVACIEAPDLEARTAIVKRKAIRSGIELPDAVATYLANFAKGNVRELEGALNALMAYSVVSNVDISIPAAQRVLRTRGDVAVGTVDIGLIQVAVAKYFGVTVELMVGRSRKQEITWARHMAMYIARRLTAESQATIGMCFGKRDHSTVVHATQAVEKRIRTEPQTSEAIQQITKELVSYDQGILNEAAS